MLEDEFAVAGLMAIKLKAGLVCDQWFKQRLALDERQGRNVPTVQVQEIEGVIDEAHPPLAVGRGLSLGKARQPSVIDAA